MYPTKLHGEHEQTPALPYSLRPEIRHDKPPLSIFFIIPDRLQLS
jgi:hypothetical protein